MEQTIAVIASICNLLSGASYFKQLLKDESVPNPATWLIWLVVTILNTVTYYIVAKRNTWLSLTSIVLALVIASIFITALVKGKFSRLGLVEILSLVFALVIGVFWKITGDAALSNICLQAIFLISFYPTIHGLLTHASKEKPLPWAFASMSYALQIINVVLSQITSVALVFPIVNLIGNGTVGLFSYFQNRLISKSKVSAS